MSCRQWVLRTRCDRGDRARTPGVREGSLAPLWHNAIHTYINLSLASPVSNSILPLHPNSLTICAFQYTPVSFQYKGLRLYSDVSVRQEG